MLVTSKRGGGFDSSILLSSNDRAESWDHFHQGMPDYLVDGQKLWIDAVDPGRIRATVDGRLFEYNFQDRIISLAHFGVGDGAPEPFQTRLMLFNPGTDSRSATSVFRSDSGHRSAILLNGQESFGITEMSVPPRGLKEVITGGAGAVETGSISVYSDPELRAGLLFSGPEGFAAVLSREDIEKDFLAPFEIDPGANVDTGLAIQNREGVLVEVDLELLDRDGSAVTSASLELPPWGHVARFPSELGLIPPTDGPFLGVVRAHATGKIAAISIQLRGNNQNGIESKEFVTLPVTPPAPSGEAALSTTTLAFAQFGNGVDASANSLMSQILLLNRNRESRVDAQVEIRDSTGQPATVQLNGEVVNGMKSVEVPPGGIVSLQSDGRGALFVGSARVTADGPLSGVIVYSGNAGAAGVSAGAVQEGSFTLPILQEEGLRSGLALASLSDVPLTVALELLTEEGTKFATTSLQISEGAQIARMIEELGWKSAAGPIAREDLSEFKGLLRIVSDGSVSATGIAVRSYQHEAGLRIFQYAALPVAADGPVEQSE